MSAKHDNYVFPKPASRSFTPADLNGKTFTGILHGGTFDGTHTGDGSALTGLPASGAPVSQVVNGLTYYNSGITVNLANTDPAVAGPTNGLYIVAS